MKPEVYRDVIADLRRRGDECHAAADVLQRLDGTVTVGSDQVVLAGLRGRMFRHADPPPTKGAWKKGRAKAGGSDDVILGVIRDGADTMKAIVAGSKVKDHVAKAAVRRLVAMKRVTTTGATKTLRYTVATK